MCNEYLEKFLLPTAEEKEHTQQMKNIVLDAIDNVLTRITTVDIDNKNMGGIL